MSRLHIRKAVAPLPAYVPGARPAGPDTAKLSSNEMPYPAQEGVVEAIRRAAGGVNRYPQMTGEDLIAALAARHGVGTGDVVVGNGSVALIQHVLDTVCDEGDDVVLPWRSFEAYPISWRVAGRRPPPSSLLRVSATNLRVRHCLFRFEKSFAHSGLSCEQPSRASIMRSASTILGAPSAIRFSSLLASSWLRLR